MRKQKLKPRTEADEQMQVIAWASLNEKAHPELKMLFGNMNGVRLSIGAAVKAKKLGNRKGLPDLMLLSRMIDGERYNGLFIEMKRSDKRNSKNGGLTAEQVETRENLESNGFYVTTCHTGDEAIGVIKNYLRIK